MKLVRHLLLSAVLVPAILLTGCRHGDGPGDEPAPESSIVLHTFQQEVTAVRGVAEVRLAIDNFPSLKYLRVVKSTSYGNLPVTLYRATIGAEFSYSYIIKKTDPEQITLEFTGYDQSRVASETVSVKVINPKDADFGKLAASDLKCVSRVTGKEDNGHDGLPAVQYTVNNQTDVKYNVGGCDLGIGWEIKPGHYGFFFGDTFGSDFKPNFEHPGPNGGAWRSNVLLYSHDMTLSDGLVIDGAAMGNGQAREICYSAHDGSGHGDWTSIPTAAVHANGADYVHYMNIKDWNGWVTSYSGLYKSEDGAATWQQVTGIRFEGESNFGQAGYYNHDGTVYMIGTKTGRTDVPYLARFQEKNIEKASEYEFWNGTGWVKGKESAAAPLFNESAGELSFSYMPKLDKWVLLYLRDVPVYDIAMRTASNPEGPWSAPVQIASGWNWAQLYGSYIHPLSKQGTTLYFIMSMWLPYNTYLMSVDLKAS